MSALSKLFAIKGVKFEKDPPSVGSLYKQSISIAWPATVEGAMLSIIGSVDTMMVGSLGYAALAAVGLASMWLAVFADVGVAVIAILNAMRTLR